MNLDKFVKKKEFVHTCPFCNEPLAISTNPQYRVHGQVGYECAKCYLPDVQTVSGNPYSKYVRAVMENVDLGNGHLFEQIIVNDTFYVTVAEKEWYIVHNNIIKGQTAIVLAEPARQEHFPYKGEKPTGLVWKGEQVIIPFVDSWEPGDESATLSKIKTYLLFL